LDLFVISGVCNNQEINSINQAEPNLHEFRGYGRGGGLKVSHLPYENFFKGYPPPPPMAWHLRRKF